MPATEIADPRTRETPLKPIRRDRRRPIACESAKPVSLRTSLRAESAPKYERAAFGFVMRGLDPRIQGRRPRDITNAPLGCPARGCSRPAMKGGGSDRGRRFFFDFSFGETKFVLAVF